MNDSIAKIGIRWVICIGFICCSFSVFGEEIKIYTTKGNGVPGSPDGEARRKGWLDNRRQVADQVNTDVALMHVGHTGGYSWWVVHMEFNLARIPANVSINSATLNFWGRSLSKDKGLIWYDHRHSPGTIDKSDYSSTFIDHLHDGKITKEPAYNSWGWMQGNVTTALQDAIRAGKHYLNIVIEREDPTRWEGGSYEIASAEDLNPNLHPYLSVDYSTARRSTIEKPAPSVRKIPASLLTRSPNSTFIRIPEQKSLAQVVKEIGNAACSILVDKNIVVKESIAIPENITLFFVPPGLLTVNSGVTLHIKGAISSPPALCFSGEGTISIENGQSVYVDWWGSDGRAIQHAINACKEGKVILLDKVYKTSSSIIGRRGIVLLGAATDEIWTKNTGTVIEYTGRKPAPILDFRGPRWFGVRNLKLVGNKRASYGLITGHRGIGSRAKYSEIDHVFIYDCGTGLDLGGTDDITISYVGIFSCGIGITGAHTQVRFYECSFVGCKVGFEVMNASKCSFYKCLWCGNQDVDILISAQDHPGGTYSFRDCWFENVRGCVLKRNASLKKTSGMGRFVFDCCKLHNYGYALMDCRGFERFGGEIILTNCDIPPTCSSYKIIDPAGKVRVIGNPFVPSRLVKEKNVYEVTLQKRTLDKRR